MAEEGGSSFAAGGAVDPPVLAANAKAEGGNLDKTTEKEKKTKDKKEKKNNAGEDEGGEGKKKSKKRLAKEAKEAEEARIKAEEEAKLAAAEEERIRLEIEAARPKTPEPDPTIHLVLKPVDSGWLMGDPLHVEVLLDSNIFQLRALLQEKKKISPHRVLIRDSKLKTLSVVQEKNSFRRLAFNDGYEFVIEPTTPGCWLWHRPEWYVNKFVKDILEVIDNSPTKQASQEELVQKVIIPLHFRDKSLVNFCRKYPEHFHVHVDTNRSQYWVRRPIVLSQLGTTAEGPGEVGKIHHYVPDKFNWAAYAGMHACLM